jgi:hypothetical protein
MEVVWDITLIDENDVWIINLDGVLYITYYPITDVIKVHKIIEKKMLFQLMLIITLKKAVYDKQKNQSF